MVIPQWLELPMSRTNLHGPKNVRVIEILLYNVIHGEKDNVGFCRTCHILTGLHICSAAPIFCKAYHHDNIRGALSRKKVLNPCPPEPGYTLPLQTV